MFNSSINAKNWDFDKITLYSKDALIRSEDFKEERMYIYFPNQDHLDVIDNKGEHLGVFPLDGGLPNTEIRKHMLAQDWDKMIEDG